MNQWLHCNQSKPMISEINSTVSILCRMHTWRCQRTTQYQNKLSPNTADERTFIANAMKLFLRGGLRCVLHWFMSTEYWNRYTLFKDSHNWKRSSALLCSSNNKNFYRKETRWINKCIFTPKVLFHEVEWAIQKPKTTLCVKTEKEEAKRSIFGRRWMEKFSTRCG